MIANLEYDINHLWATKRKGMTQTEALNILQTRVDACERSKEAAREAESAVYAELYELENKLHNQFELREDFIKKTEAGAVLNILKRFHRLLTKSESMQKQALNIRREMEIVEKNDFTFPHIVAEKNEKKRQTTRAWIVIQKMKKRYLF
ncbi:hypothetical protein OS493_020776 [Desmophyllum pertusum]|uniref:Uncharacterized protein n=1 Tax=Desmophyllum pertusum TaxID=174260 RepID=A0A9X0CM36_9CNID|nr:hypothetical protein OS493_020776 [Desmophyllum pertusum]